MTDHTLDSFFEQFSKLPKYVLEVGVFTDDSHNKREDTVYITKSGKKLKHVVSKKRDDLIKKKELSGITNAELMFIHEYGSPLNNIPARPVLRMTIDWANKSLVEQTVDKCINAYLESGFDEDAVTLEIEKACLKIQNYARRIIYSNDGRLAPNSKKVAEAKKGNHPLFDTGQLARSITCRAIIVR